MIVILGGVGADLGGARRRRVFGFLFAGTSLPRLPAALVARLRPAGLLALIVIGLVIIGLVVSARRASSAAAGDVLE